MGDTCEKPAGSIIHAILRVVQNGAVTASRLLSAIPSPNAPYGPAPRTGNGQISVGGRNIDLTARAVRVCNRDQTLTKRYLELHRTLSMKSQNKEPCYE